MEEEVFKLYDNGYKIVRNENGDYVLLSPDNLKNTKALEEILEKAALEREFPGKDDPGFPSVTVERFIGWRLLGCLETKRFITSSGFIFKTNSEAWLGEFRIGIVVNSSSKALVFVDENCPDVYICDGELKDSIIKISNDTLMNESIEINITEGVYKYMDPGLSSGSWSGISYNPFNYFDHIISSTPLSADPTIISTGPTIPPTC